MVDMYGIIQKTAERLRRPTAHTVNLLMAGCGNVILPHIALPASMSNGGFLMPTPYAKFYIYGLLRPNGKVFYVGKGTKKRMYAHVQEARSGHRCYKCNVIRKILRNGGSIGYCTYWAGDDQDEAYEQEKYWIAFYGMNTLSNGTEGGVGGKGHVTSEQQRRQISEKALRRWQDQGRREEARERTRQFWQNPEYRKRVLEGARQGNQKPEGRMSKSEHARQRWQDPEFRERVTKKSQATKRRLREEQLQDPEYQRLVAEKKERKRQSRLKPKDPNIAPRLCSVPGCGKKHAARGYCDNHWHTAKRRGLF